MTRRALARVAPLLILLLGGFGAVGYATLHATAAPGHPTVPSDHDRSPAVAADVAANDVLVSATNRTSDDTGRSSHRLFSVTLAALVALVALLAARSGRLFVARAVHRDASVESRRRGPPLLRCA